MRNQILEAKARACRRAIGERIQRALCPIYGVGIRYRPQLVGSAVPFAVGARLFLITAAHVLDENEKSTLYIPEGNTLVELVGNANRISVPAVDKEKDDIDFGFMLLSDKRTDAYSFPFLTPSDLDVQDQVDPRTIYAFSGFPETKNRPSFFENTLQRSTMVLMLNPSPMETYAQLGLNPHHHFVGDFDRTNQVDEEKQRITAPTPAGISGGGVWKVGHVEDLVRGIRRERLIGIALQYRKDLRVLFGVRISLLVAAIAKYCPETACLLPQPSFRLNVVSDEDATGAT